VHVVSEPGSTLATELRLALAGLAQVAVWHTMPVPTQLELGTLLVLDVDVLGPALPHDLEAFVARAGVVLVLGERPIPAAWADLLRDRALSTVRLDQAARRRDYRPVVTLILERLRGPPAAAIAAIVLNREPTLHPLKSCVAALCEAPWQVRRPLDLAHHAHTTLGVLKRRCHALGFARVEHFILSVRMVAYEQLLAQMRLTPAHARTLVGLTNDASNVRRQVRRAIRGSPAAAHALRGG
jgi:hypothetical protein